MQDGQVQFPGLFKFDIILIDVRTVDHRIARMNGALGMSELDLGSFLSKLLKQAAFFDIASPTF